MTTGAKALTDKQAAVLAFIAEAARLRAAALARNMSAIGTEAA